MKFNKKNKIVATIGPSSEKEEVLRKLVENGLNVMRLNFSHGDFEEHGNRVKVGRKVAKDMGVPLAILQDLSGPKIRIGDFDTEEVELINGKKFILTVEEITGNVERVTIKYPNALKEVNVGDVICLNDGKQKLKVVEKTGKDLVCKILIGGKIRGRRGVNFPDSKLSVSSLTEKDKKDVKFGIEQDVDYMALSFVRRASDVMELREILKKHKADIEIIAKIETKEALENLEEIIMVSDGVMVARGDLGVEVPAEEVPIYQKEIISMCNELGKPVITATQMMASMTVSEVPTRAEVTDVANAILDGTDAIMLSEETTVGSHPDKVVSMMNKVALHTEKHIPYDMILERNRNGHNTVDESIGHSVANMARELDAKYIVSFSKSGFSARYIAKQKSSTPILVVTKNKKTYNRLALSFNCHPIFVKEFKRFGEALEEVKKVMLKDGYLKKGDLIVVSASVPFAEDGGANTISVQNV